MNIDFENIVPWNGANDTGRDARLKLERNFKKLAEALSELNAGDNELLDLIAERLSKVADDEAVGHILFKNGITVESPLTTQQLKNGHSVAVLESGPEQDSLSFNITEKGNDTDILAPGISEVSTEIGTDSGRLGDLDDVSGDISKAPKGSIFVKSLQGWDYTPPVDSKNTEYDRMLIPVYHLDKGLMFIKLSSLNIGGGDNPPPEITGFPLRFPIKLK